MTLLSALSRNWERDDGLRKTDCLPLGAAEHGELFCEGCTVGSALSHTINIMADMGAINFCIPGPPRILIVDITNDINGFEYRTSSELFCRLKQAGIDLASDNVVRPTTDGNYAAVFDRADLNFNTLLLVAHGAPDASEAKASTVAIAGGRSDWYTLASLTSSISDKLICLAVCHGHCRDAIDAFVSGEFALALVAPEKTLAPAEIVAFFPAFFTNLRNSSPVNIDPNDIKHCVAEQNLFANHKMKMFSEGVSC